MLNRLKCRRLAAFFFFPLNQQKSANELYSLKHNWRIVLISWWGGSFLWCFGGWRMLLDVQVLGSKSCVFCQEKELLELIFLVGEGHRGLESRGNWSE